MRERRGDYHGRGAAPAVSPRARPAGGGARGAKPSTAPGPGAGGWPIATALALAFAIALALRLAPLASGPGGELVADSAFHMRMIEEVVAHGRVPSPDVLCEAPEGRATPALLPTGLYHAIATLHRALAPLDHRDARFHALLFTALAGALVVLPVFVAARALFARPGAAASAALLAALVPAHLHRTYAYWLRYDALGTLLAITHVALMLHALAAPGRRRAVASAALAALALLGAVACWRVALVLPFAELGFVLLWAAWRGASREVREPVTILFALSAALFPFVPWLSAQSFLLSGAWLAACATIAALWLPWLAPARGRWPARAALLALALAAGWGLARLFPRTEAYAATFALVPARLAVAFGARPELSPIVALELGIQELAALSPFGLMGPGALSWLAPWFVAAPFLLAWGAGGGMRRRLGALAVAPALFAALCLAMTLLTLLFERNKVLLAPLVAIACGGLAARLGDRARDRRATHTVLAILFIVCAAITAFHAVTLATSRRPALAPGLGGALEFLRDRTPAGAIVMSPWEHGYEVQSYTGRATTMDGLIESAENQRRIVAFAGAAMARAPDALAALCDRQRAGWLLVPPSTHLYALAVVARAPFLAKLLPGAPLTPAEADRVLIQMMVLGREYPGFEKVFERDGYRVYRVARP
jgi:asparagine N-glycosylation enzyme membrane subunit Stt3